MKSAVFRCIALVLLAGCTGEHSDIPGPSVPGEPLTLATRLLDAGAALLQDRSPVNAINAYLNGFHFYSGKMSVQMEAHHYCTNLNEEVIQCVIYDGGDRSARLVGLEYIISARLFTQLPAKEKPLWHSHVHEVKSGQLVAPGIPEVVERQLMKRLVGTYGKTWHTWHSGRQTHALQRPPDTRSLGGSVSPSQTQPLDTHSSNSAASLPLGVPQLMMGFTADGQADAAMVAHRDASIGVDSAERRARRASIPSPLVDAAADAWQKGHAFQIRGPSQEADPHPSALR